jgi:diacylglycerol kinase family enzyme
MWRRRLAALAALALAAVAIGMAAALVLIDPGREVLRILLIAGALAAAWQGLRRRGAWRALGLGGGALLMAANIALLVTGRPWLLVGLVAALVLGIVAGAAAFTGRVALPRGPRPRFPVLFFNARSGGGKAARYHLADEARMRGIEPIELVPGADLAALVQQALDAGADALAMAGGDGSQATVAALAAESRVPYACIPAGTRNHFALDLGVDRDDVVGALDALVDGGERVVDLAEVNGRVFVNNVSVGLYGHAVQQKSYRGAKLRTVLETVPVVLGPAVKPDVRWRAPDGEPQAGSVAIVVSNNAYRLEPAPGAGTRPRLDEGVLGVAVLGAGGKEGEVRPWAAPSFELDADGPVPVGLDGEALVLDPPLRFRCRPRALRCRIARHHPGASPAALTPARAWETVAALVGIAVGRGSRSAAEGRPPPRAPVEHVP